MPGHIFKRLATLLLAFMLMAGCGSDGLNMAPVSGHVTLDGQPLEGATVLFQGTGEMSGRPSAGRTDEEGRYELIYTADREGGLVGEYEVSITTFYQGDPDVGRKTVPERVPAKYNRNTTLTATINPEDNVLDFHLMSDGEIPQTDEEFGE